MSGGAAVLLQIRYLIFLLPFGVAALLLMVSALTGGGGDDDGDGAEDAGGGDDSDGEGEGEDSDDGENESNGLGHSLLGFVGIGRGAPRTLVWNALALAWGVCGIAANQILLPGTGEPTLVQFLPVLGIALVGGIVGARGTAEIAVRLMPQTQSRAISREALIGLAGKALFPISETGGRVRIYDEHGALHDESCRVAPNAAPIAKGRRVLVLDRDKFGRLIVEETHGPSAG